jgi:hypothetical protein
MRVFSTESMHQSDAALQKWFKTTTTGSQFGHNQQRRRFAHALKNPFYQGAIYDKAQKKRTAHIHAPLNRSGNRLRESRSNPNNSKRADQLRPNSRAHRS